jgi:hypothetical protein
MFGFGRFTVNRRREASGVGKSSDDEPSTTSFLLKTKISKINPWHNVSGMKGDLLCLRKEVFGIAIERHLADAPHRDKLFGMIFVGSSRSKSKLCSFFPSTICTHGSHSG